MEPRFVYMTAGSTEEARRLARRLIEDRLAACVNFVPGMHAVYRWQGEICEDEEVIVIAKTTAAQLPALEAAVKAEDSDECPCIVALPIVGGHEPFLTWIMDNTGSIT